ncbi:hypothetical protein P3T27_006875 [Kitasatospora sp. MAA19]|uniref:hypothetical protein n=1 Tax=Kitasatospora sp. MAA19 TaxID=3035090 RepID=UPI002476B17F|nr:hypothetical protein [Kitasatospora sp. MAA19]MDH6710126.1 hypothetical protein [Kitasatospora sp. MAA19]
MIRHIYDREAMLGSSMMRRRNLVRAGGIGAGLAVVTTAVLTTSSVAVWAGGVVVAAGTTVATNLLVKAADHVRRSPSLLTASVETVATDYIVIPDSERGTTDLVPESGHVVRVTVQTSSAGAVVLSNAVPEIVSRQVIDPGAARMPRQGVIDVRPFDLRLDKRRPKLKPSGAWDFPFKITSTDPEVLSIRAHTVGHDVQWRLTLHWIGPDGGTGEMIIGAAGVDSDPFRTAGLPRGA